MVAVAVDVRMVGSTMVEIVATQVIVPWSREYSTLLIESIPGI